MSNPILLITNGSTGSGKGSLPDKVGKIISPGKHIDFKWKNAFVDDLVENSIGYKNAVDAIIRSCNNPPTDPPTDLPTDPPTDICDDKILDNAINDPSDKLLNEFNKAYAKARFGVKCVLPTDKVTE